MLCLLFLVMLLDESLVLLFCFLKLITFIVSTWGIPMVRPGSHTHPTELMFTLPTGHVITPLVLLYILRTPRTLLAIGYNPSDVFTLCWVLDLPFLCHLTVTRSVWVKIAFEAEHVPTFTEYLMACETLHFNTELTVRLWTPFHILIIIRITFGKIFTILHSIISREISQPYLMSYL